MNETSYEPNVLIVDDTPANLTLLGAMLKEQGFRVRLVPNGRLGLEAARRELPDLILLDINMPEMDGFETCRRFKATAGFKEIPIIFISALSDSEDKVKAFHVGGVDYITKPFRVEEVVARVETHLALRQLTANMEAKNRELEKSLNRREELEAIKERLVQMIVHDLKNPLCVVMFNSDVVLDDLPAAATSRKAMGDVVEAAQQMNRMVLNILDVVGSEEVGLHPNLQSVDLGELLRSTASAFAPRAARIGLDLRVEDELGPDPVQVDPDLIQRVIENLVDNACKYAPGDSVVELRVRRAEDGQIAIAVRDQGPGVPLDEREQVFEVHQRLERDSRIGSRHSRGLGLALCKLAVEAHGGSIWIEDAEPSGVAFCIRLPVPSDD